MKINKLIVSAIFITLIFNSGFAQNDSTVAVTELKRMNETFGYRVQMRITKDGSIASFGSAEIQMSLSKLKQISSVTRKDIRFYIVRFIVAHEFAHQIQYYRYSKDTKFMNNDLVSKTLIETQADILAGLIFYRMSPELMIYQKSHPTLVNDVLKEIFNVTYNIGVNENTLDTHPSKRDRMLAVRLGLTNGKSFVYDQWVKSDTARAIQNGITFPIFKKQMDELFRFIDLRNGEEDMIAWSYRQAKRIVNYDRKISTGIVLVNPASERIIWHTEISNPYVNYKLTYKNIANRSIDTEMEVFVVHVNRKTSNSPETYKKVSVDHHKFSLLPGQTKTIEGKLSWLKNENSLLEITDLKDSDMPRIVYPGLNSDDGIYACSYSNDLSNQVYQSTPPSYKLENSSEPTGFLIFFNKMLNQCRSNPLNVIKGIGEVNVKYPDENTYVSSIQYEDETLTLVSRDNPGKITTVELFLQNTYPDANKLYTKYGELKQALNLELDGSKMEEGEIGEGYYWISYTGNEYDVYLETIKDDKAKYYSIKLQIFFE